MKITVRRLSTKHPLVAIPLASARIVFFALRHGAKPMRVDYRTGDVWLDIDTEAI